MNIKHKHNFHTQHPWKYNHPRPSSSLQLHTHIQPQYSRTSENCNSYIFPLCSLVHSWWTAQTQKRAQTTGTPTKENWTHCTPTSLQGSQPSL